MADGTTTNLGLTLPEVGASTDSWGRKLNDDLIFLDNVFSRADPATTVTLLINNQEIETTNSYTLSTVLLGDDRQLQFGAAPDYHLIYDATNTRLELNTADNGSGAGTVFQVTDGADTVDFTGKVTAASLTLASPATNVTGISTDTSLGSSDALLATQLAIKTYVDAQVTAADLDINTDSGGPIDIDLDSESLTLTGGAGLDSTATDATTVSFAIDSTVATLTGSQTLTNKTLTTPIIASISNTGTLTLPTSSDTLVGRATTDTLTNKTLTAPVIATISNTGTLTLPSSTDTLVGRATTDTLTNKSISGSTNTLSAIANGSLTNDSVSYGGVEVELGASNATPAFNLGSATAYPGDSSLVTAGTLAVASLFINSDGATVTGIKDEDTMSSNSATKLATQQSIKAYVDSQVGTVDTLKEVLANGNETDGTNLVVTNGDTLTTNTILETTAGDGVTIDSVLVKDNAVTATTFTGALVGNASTATTAATVTDATQTAITSAANLATVGTLGSGAISSGFGNIDVGSSNIDGGTITADTALVGTLSTASQTNITGVGTVTTGVWDAGALTSSGIITADSSSAGDYVRMYGSTGTAQWDIYGSGENLRFSENSGGGGKVDIDTDLNVDGGVDITGNVGIGMAASTGALNILEATAGTQPLRIDQSSATPYGINVDFSGASQNNRTYHWLAFEDSTTDKTTFWSDGGASFVGDVAIGTTPSTAGVLRMKKGGNINVRNAANDANIEIVGHNSTNDDVYFGSTSGSGAVYLRSGGTNGISIDSSQDVNIPNGGLAIGTTSSPASQLHVLNTSGTTGFIVSRGTVESSPTMQMTTDSATNFFDAWGDLSFRTAATSGSVSQIMRLTDDGHIGLGGLTAPTGILSIPSNDTTTKPQVRFMSGDATDIADAALSTTDDSGGTELLVGSNLYYSNGSRTRFTTSRAGSGVECSYVGRLKFFVGSGSSQATQQMTLDTNGYLGLGVTSPGKQVHIKNWQDADTVVLIDNQMATGNTSAGAVLSIAAEAGNYDPKITFGLGGGGNDWAMGIDNDDGDKFKISGGTDVTPALETNPRLTIDGSGNCGIGDTSPDFKLEVDGSVCLGRSTYGSGYDNTVADLIISNDDGGASILLDGQDTSNHAALINYGVQGDRRLAMGINDSNTANTLFEDTAICVNQNGVGIGNLSPGYMLQVNGTCRIDGALSKSSGSFRIDHPLPSKSETHDLVHSFIEGPKADLIYRGTVDLSGGYAQVDLDDAAGMTEGTWELLCRDPQCWIQNDTGWSAVRGDVEGNTLTIECEATDSNDTVSWLVVAERCDPHMMETDWTDDNGHVIVEPEKPQPEEEE